MRPFARRLSTVISATSALGLVAFAPAAFAQEDPGASSDDAGEIIVTARRRDERLVDVPIDRKSVVEGKSVSVRVDLGGRRIINKKTRVKHNPSQNTCATQT